MNRHRGQHRDLTGAVGKALVVSGHLVVIALLGLLVEREETGYLNAAAAAVPDRDPPGTP